MRVQATHRPCSVNISEPGRQQTATVQLCGRAATKKGTTSGMDDLEIHEKIPEMFETETIWMEAFSPTEKSGENSERSFGDLDSVELLTAGTDSKL